MLCHHPCQEQKRMSLEMFGGFGGLKSGHKLCQHQPGRAPSPIHPQVSSKMAGKSPPEIPWVRYFLKCRAIAIFHNWMVNLTSSHHRTIPWPATLANHFHRLKLHCLAPICRVEIQIFHHRTQRQRDLAQLGARQGRGIVTFAEGRSIGKGGWPATKVVKKQHVSSWDNKKDSFRAVAPQFVPVALWLVSNLAPWYIYWRMHKRILGICESCGKNPAISPMVGQTTILGWNPILGSSSSPKKTQRLAAPPKDIWDRLPTADASRLPTTCGVGSILGSRWR